MRAVNMEARRQAIGVITKLAKFTLTEGPPDVNFDRCWDRKYTKEERAVRIAESSMP